MLIDAFLRIQRMTFDEPNVFDYYPLSREVVIRELFNRVMRREGEEPIDHEVARKWLCEVYGIEMAGHNATRDYSNTFGVVEYINGYYLGVEFCPVKHPRTDTPISVPEPTGLIDRGFENFYKKSLPDIIKPLLDRFPKGTPLHYPSMADWEPMNLANNG